VPRPHLIPILATAALIAAACGSSSKNDYVDSVNHAEAALQKSLSSLNTSIGGDPTKAAAQLNASGNAIEKAAGDFKQITPPDDAKDAHGKIVDGLHELAGEFHSAAKAANSKDIGKLMNTVTSLSNSKGIKEIAQAQDELEAAGYKFKQQS
jgi:hypothetical protein